MILILQRRFVRFFFLVSGVSYLCLVPGCKEITEADSYYQGQVIVFSKSLERIGSLPISESPGCLVTIPGCIVVAAKSGNLRLYDSETFQLIGVEQVGPSASEGYTDMIHIPKRNSLYLIGSYGNILDIDLPDCIVTDMFSVCQYPVRLLYEGDYSPYFYVVDGANHYVKRVSLSFNTSTTFHQFDEPVREIAVHAPDSLFVSSGGELILLEFPVEGPTICSTAFLQEAECLGTVWNRNYSVAMFDGHIGTLRSEVIEEPPWFAWLFEKVESVEGIPVTIICNEYLSAYLLSYYGDGYSLLTRYDYTTGSILNQEQIQGFPLDITVSSSGNVFVLTAIE